MGFFLISFLEELIHYFIHQSDKRSKKSKRQLSQKDEFEIYDKNQRKEKTAKTYSIEDSEVGMLVYKVVVHNITTTLIQISRLFILAFSPKVTIR